MPKVKGKGVVLRVLRGYKKRTFKQPRTSYVLDCFLLNGVKLMIKKVAVIVALVMIASLSVAGCTVGLPSTLTVYHRSFDI